MGILPCFCLNRHYLGRFYKRLCHWIDENSNSLGFPDPTLSCACHTCPLDRVHDEDPGESGPDLPRDQPGHYQLIPLFAIGHARQHHIDPVLPRHDGADGGFQDQVRAPGSLAKSQLHIHDDQPALLEPDRFINYKGVFLEDREIRSADMALIPCLVAPVELQLLHQLLYLADVLISRLLAPRFTARCCEGSIIMHA